MLFKSVNLKKNEGYYFPLFNKHLKSSITPNLLGDLKKDYNSYFLEPVSELDLFESYGRHVIMYVDGKTYTLSGKGHLQQEDEVVVNYYALYQEIERLNPLHNIRVTSFMPLDDALELHKVSYKNTTKKNQTLKVVIAIPMYGRSASNIFDHRHVTSLLSRVKVIEKGILLKPTLSFDERGHILNNLSYATISNSENLKIEGYIPTYDDFVNGGSLLYPKGNKLFNVGDKINGYEALGGISYKEVTIKPNEEITFYFGLCILEDEKEVSKHLSYLNEKTFNNLLKESKVYFESLFNELKITLKDKETSNFLSFIPIQPTLRRLFGNSYLPHHDYGKGGRGWRDLFQDLIYLILIFDKRVKEMLVSNFKGIRIDGSNATIIGDKLGEFKADRNNITRIWSDHGVWPLYTLNKYINTFNDYNILMIKETYHDDQFTHFTKKTKEYHKDNLLRNDKEIYQGTILEHLLLQNITNSLNLGEKGFVRLEDADWNDGLDMASEKGETIAFTHFYLNNLKILNSYLDRYQQVELFPSLYELITSKKKDRLQAFFDKVANFNEISKFYETKEIIKHISKHISYLESKLKETFMKNGALQSYIDNDGEFLDKDTVSLTGQAMALLNKTVKKEEASLIAKTTKKHLYNSSNGGYHLNENYKEVKLNMGRAYGFSYNHKENGAVFSHMVLMYTKGLFNYELGDYGREALYSLIKRAKAEDSKVALGIPEYFTEKGEGKYLYLTGSATWLLLVLKESLFGIKYIDGCTYIKPQLKGEDFIDGRLTIKTIHYSKKTTFEFINPNNLDEYKITIKAEDEILNQGFNKHFKKIEVYFHD